MSPGYVTLLQWFCCQPRRAMLEDMHSSATCKKSSAWWWWWWYVSRNKDCMYSTNEWTTRLMHHHRHSSSQRVEWKPGMIMSKTVFRMCSKNPVCSICLIKCVITWIEIVGKTHRKIITSLTQYKMLEYDIPYPMSSNMHMNFTSGERNRNSGLSIYTNVPSSISECYQVENFR